MNSYKCRLQNVLPSIRSFNCGGYAISSIRTGTFVRDEVYTPNVIAEKIMTRYLQKQRN